MLKKTAKAFFLIMLLSGCKPEIQPSKVPETSFATGGQKAQCEDLTVSGFPRLKTPRNDTFFICRDGLYAINYDPVRKTSLWVTYKIIVEDFSGEKENLSSEILAYRQDPLIPVKLQSKLDDFTGTGYEKGHLVDVSSIQSNKLKLSASYYLSAILPENDLYKNVWAELSRASQFWATSGKDLYIIKGPIYGRNGTWIGVPDSPSATSKKARIGQVEVPESIFIIFVDAKTKKSIAFIVPNKEPGLNEKVLPAIYYATRVKDVEDQTGITFMSDLNFSESDNIKNNVDPYFWAWQ